jgi:hypothetical protein
MSWWDSGAEVLGDGPADQFTAAWRRVLGGRGSRGQGLPMLDELLAAFAASLAGADLEPPCARLVLQRDGVEPLVFECRVGGPEDLQEAFAGVLPAIVQDYRSTLGRAPTPNELAKTMQFVVSQSPEDYLADGAGALSWKTSRLRGEPPADPV